MTAATAKWDDGVPIGGHFNNMISTARKLAERGHRIHIVVPSSGHTSVAEPLCQELTRDVTLHIVGQESGETDDENQLPDSIRFRVSHGVRSFLSVVRKTLSLHEKNEFDVVHGHSGFPSVSVIPAAVGLRGRDVATVHTLYCPVTETRLRTPAYKLLFSQIDLLVGISDNVYSSIRRISSSAATTIAPLVGDEYFDTRDADAEESDDIEVLFVGNTVENKGLDTLIAAFDTVVDTHPDATLYLALDVPVEVYEAEEDAIKREIRRRGLTENVVPVGIVDDLPALMQSVDMFVTPFKDTQGPADYPVSLLEAMATGTPVIATKVGGIPEIIRPGETGLLCPPADPGALTKAMLTIANDDQLSDRLGSQARRAMENLNSDIVNRTERAYTDALNT